MRELGVAVVAAAAFALAFVGLFVASFHAPDPHDLRVGVVAPAPFQERLEERLAREAPGAFELVSVTSGAAAREALLEQDLRGALVVESGSATVLVTGATSFAAEEAIRGAFGAAARAAGLEVDIRDLRPLPDRDSRGLSSLFTVIGIVIPSLLFAAAQWALVRDARLAPQLAALGAFALLAGFIAALSVDWIVAALDDFWAVAGFAALLALAVAAPIAGLARLLGPPGVALGALLFVVLGLSSSGGPVGYWFLPGFFRIVSQWLQPGAAITAIRNSVYFDGANLTQPVLLLSGWALAGVALLVAAERRQARARVAAA